MKSSPFRSAVWFWGRKEIARHVALCIVSRPFLLARILLMTTLGKMVVVCIYVSRMWRKEVESSPSNDKRSGSNESSGCSHLSEFPPCVAILALFLSAQASRRKAARDQFSIPALDSFC